MNRFCTNDPYVKRVVYSRCPLSTQLRPLRPQEQTSTLVLDMAHVDSERTFGTLLNDGIRVALDSRFSFTKGS